MESFKRILEKYQLEKWFQRDNLIVLILVGILLVVIVLPTEKEQEKDNKAVREEVQEDVVTGKVEESLDYYGDLQKYTEYLEERLENILQQMNGVGEVSVMITLEASEKQIVEKEESMMRNNITENDSQGGSRNVYEMDINEQTVYSKVDSTQLPYVTQTILPEISGVVIVAQGAESIGVKKSMVEIAQVLFDIEVHKISVVAMGEKKER